MTQSFYCSREIKCAKSENIFDNAKIITNMQVRTLVVNIFDFSIFEKSIFREKYLAKIGI